MIKPAAPDHAGDPVRSTAVVNLPNLLTVLRLFIVPVFAWVLLRDGGHDSLDRVIAACLFVVAGVTDLVDGELARRRHLVTTFGKVADPIADKVLVGTALILLSVLGDLPWWITWLILVRELGVTGLRFWVIRRGVIPASRGGKAKTLAQMLAILLYLLPLDGGWLVVRAAVLAVAVVLTVATGLDYVVRAAQLRRAARPSA